MGSWKFSHEPVAWLSAVVAVAILAKNLLQHEPLTEVIVEPVLVALGGVIVRSKVTPVAKDK